MVSVPELIEKLYRVVDVMCGEIRTSRDYGIGFQLCHSEIHLLDAVGAHEGENAGELAKKLGVSGAAVSQVAKRLIGKGLVQAYRGAKNQREMFFHLTDSGRMASAGHGKHHEKFYADILDYCDRVTEWDIAAVSNFLDAVVCSMADNGEELGKLPRFSSQKLNFYSTILKLLKCRRRGGEKYRMITLGSLKDGMTAKVVSIDGDGRFLSRIAAMGIVPGSSVEMISNREKYPLLVFERGTVVAINRPEGEKINVEIVGGDR
jgi:ferrous iron transport protein A